MASLQDLIVRVGVEGIPAFKGAFRDAIEALDQAGARAVGAGTKISKAFENLGVEDAAAKVATQVAKLNASFDLLKKSFDQGKISASDFAKASDGLESSLRKLGNTTEPLTAKLGEVSTSAKNMGVTLSFSVTAPLVGIAGASLKAAADMESLEIGLRAVTKETGPLSAQLERLKEVAKLPGLGFKEAVQGSINLQAAGFSANTAERALKAFGNALATVGKGRVELDGVVTALSQIASKGKISAEEINQLAERLPQIRVAIKDAFGEGFTDAKAFEAAGITSEIFVEKIIKQFEKLPKAAGGFKNDLENLRDSAEQTLATFGKALIPFASSALQSIQPLIEGLKSVALQFAQMPGPIQAAVVGIAALAAATGPALYAFGGMADGAKALISVLGKLGGTTAGVTGLSGTISTLGATIAALGPAAAVLAGVATAGYGLYSLKPQAEELSAVLRQVAKDYQSYIEALKEGAAAAVKPFAMMGEQAVVVAGFLAELSPAFVSARAGINAFRDDAASTTPVFGEVSKAFEEMRSRFTLFDLTGFGMATAAVREWGIITIDWIKRVTGSYPEMAAAAERNLARVQKANMDAMRVPLTGITGVAAVRSDVSANMAELKAAQETLKLLKAMKASKEELAEATARVTNAQRKLHPELTATGNAAGSTAKHADDLSGAMSRLVKDGGANEFKKLNADLLAIEKGFLQGKVSLEELTSAYDTYDKKVSESFKKTADAYNKLVADSDKAALAVSQSFAKAALALQEDYKRDLKPVEITLKLKDQIGPELFAKYEAAVKSAKDLATALKVAGVSQISIVEQADDLARAYREIAASVGKIGGASQGQADQARLRFLEAEIKAQRELNGDVQKYQEELTNLLAVINDVKSADDAYRNAGLETLTALQVEAERAAKAYEIIATTGKDSAVRVLTAQQKALEAQREVAIATGQAWDGIDDQLSRVADRLARATSLKGVSDLQAAFNTFANSAGAAITKSFGDAFDALIKGDFKGVGKAFSSMWKGVAESAVKSFTDPLKNALGEFFGKTVRDLLKGSLSGVKEDIKDIASVIKGLLGITSTATSAVSAASAGANVANTAANVGDLGAAAVNAGSAAAGAAGSAASSIASSSITSIVGAVSGVVSAVSGVVSNFQFSAMNKALDNIVKHTLQTANDLANLRADSWTREGHLMTKLDDLFQFTWRKFDDLINAVRNISLTGATAGEGGELTGIGPLVSAIHDSATRIVDALAGLGKATGAASDTTQTIVLSSVQEMTDFLAKLTKDQSAAFEALPPELKEAINAGKLADLVNGQDQAIKDALAGYLKITNELKQVRDAVNALKPAAEATATASASSAFELAQVRANINPTNGGFDTSSVLAGLAAFSDRMAGYWERLFEVLAAGGGTGGATSATATSFNSPQDAQAFVNSRAGGEITQAELDRLRNTPGVTFGDAAAPAAPTGSVGLTAQFDYGDFVSNERRKLVENVTADFAKDRKPTDFAPFNYSDFVYNERLKLQEQITADFRKTAAPAGFQATAYIPPDYSSSYINTVPRSTMGATTELNGLLIPSPADWQNTRAPQVSNWTSAPAGPTSGGGYPMPQQIPIQVAIDGKVIAERMAVYYEQLGYR